MKKIKWKHILTSEEVECQVAQLLERYPKFSDMDAKCKCCANCPSWNVDHSLGGGYEYNTCIKAGSAAMVKCCVVCDMYSGNRIEDNIPAYELILTEQIIEQ